MRNRLRVDTLLPCTLILTACAPKAAPIGSEVHFQPTEREQRLWKTVDEMSSQLQSSGKLYANHELQGYVQSVLNRVAGAEKASYAPLHLRVYILDAPSINAFAMPNGDVYVHTGMLGRIRSEAQLAMVLGHEMTHSTHRHSFQQLEHAYSATGVNAYVSVLSAAGGSNVQQAVGSLGGMMTMAAVSGYGRNEERQADQVGLERMAKAGYDPHEGAETFRQMLAATEKGDRKWNFFYATHPRMKERAEVLESLQSTLSAGAGSHTDVGQDRYAAAAEPLIHAEIERHIAQGKFALAEQSIDYLSRVRPSALALSHAGDLYRARGVSGDIEKAEKAYQQALAMDATCGPAHRGLGMLLARLGKKSDAVSHLRRYVTIASNNPDAAYIRQYADQLAKDK